MMAPRADFGLPDSAPAQRAGRVGPVAQAHLALHRGDAVIVVRLPCEADAGRRGRAADGAGRFGERGRRRLVGQHRDRPAGDLAAGRGGRRAGQTR